MTQEIHNPLRQYRDEFAQRFVEEASKEFEKLLMVSGVDARANAATVGALRNASARLKSVKRSLTWLWVACIALWVGVAAGIVTLCLGAAHGSAMFLTIAGMMIAVALLLALIHPAINKARRAKENTTAECNHLQNQASAQMAPLNRLFDWDIFSRLLNRTIPFIKIDPYHTDAHMRMLVYRYGWIDDHDDTRSVMSIQGGSLNGNPFVLRNVIEHHMGTKTYTGSKTVSVSKTVRDDNGNLRSVSSSEVLTASIEKPYPEYDIQSELIYANDAAPNLEFTRSPNNSKMNAGSLRFAIAKRKLKKLSRNMKQDFAMMSNEEFEVLFNTSDRNDNQQYALLFTPVAQSNMTELLRDKAVGYGDDFCFFKQGKMNAIVPGHLQTVSLDWSPNRFRTYDLEEARELFVRINADTFRHVYFALAPLLAIPIYQHMRPADHEIPQPTGHCSIFEHEALANAWGQDKFRSPDSVSTNILKTVAVYNPDGSTGVEVRAYGYRSERRVEYVVRRSSDGCAHSVPVYWDEYIPVEGGGSFTLEETTADVGNLDPVTRAARIDQWANRLGPDAAYYKHFSTRLT